jgi:hypothetical protein
MKNNQLTAIALVILAILLAGCGEEFDPRAQINAQRFLAITVDPIEASPGETVTFGAAVTESDGSQYEGSIAWTILTSDAVREGENTEIDATTSFLQMPGGPAFTWVVPEEKVLTEMFGEKQESGRLLTVAAVSFKGGELSGDPVTAFKLMIVSDRGPDERFDNPSIVDFYATNSSGERLDADEDGVLVTSRSRVIFTAVPDEFSTQLDYSWFSDSNDFEPEDLTDTQGFKPGKNGTFSVYCIQRKSHFFVSDDNARTRVAGIDWAMADIRFE